MRVGRATGHEWLRLGEAATELGVSANTLRRWSDSGRVRSYRSPGGHRRYRRSDLEALLEHERADDARSGSPPATDLLTPGHSLASLLTLARVAADGVGVPECRISVLVDDGAFHVLRAQRRDGGGRLELRDEGVASASPVAREALRTGRRLIIADLSSSTLLAREEADAMRSLGDAAVLAVPVPAHAHAGAVLELVEWSPRTFSGANVAFAEFTARQIAGLLGPDGDGRGEPDTGFLDGGETGHASVPPDPEDFLLTLADRLRHGLHAVACDVLRYDPDARLLQVVASSGTGDPPLTGLQLPVDELGDAASALATGERTLADLPATAPAGGYLSRHIHRGARSVMASPLRAGEHVLGLLAVYGERPAWTPDRDGLATGEAACSLAAAALSGGQDAAVLSRRLAHLEDLVAGSTRSVTPDTDGLVLSTLTALRARPMFDACTLYRVSGGVAEPFPVGDAAGNPVRDGAPWHLSAYPPAAMAAAGREVVTVTAEPAGSATPNDAFLLPRGLSGVVLAPVVFWDQLVGLLEFGASSQEGLATAAAVAQAAADLLAAALGGGDVIARLRRRNRDLSLVVKAGLEDNARLSTDEILHAVAERLSTLTGTPVADLYSIEGDVLRALVSYDGGRFDADRVGVVLPLDRYPCCRRAVETGEIAVATDLDDPILDDEGRHSLEKWGYRSQLAMPLTARGRVLGVIELSDYRPRDFLEDFDLIRGLGQVAANALENASLFEEADRRNRILNDLVEIGSHASRAHDLDELVRGVAERVLHALDAANCDIYRVLEDGLRCVASYDRSGHDESVLGGVFELARYPTAAEAVFNHQVLMISSAGDPQLSEDERATYHEYGFSSEACLPLVVNDELHGLLDVYDTRERDFTEYLGFLRGVAQTLAGEFENARLMERLTRRADLLLDVLDAGGGAAAGKDPQEVLDTLAERLKTSLQAASCGIYALRGGGGLSCLARATRSGPDASAAGQELDAATSPAAALAVTAGAPVVVADLDDPRLGEEERARMAALGLGSELVVPLLNGDEVIGLVDVHDERSRDYAEHMEFLHDVSRTAAGLTDSALLVQTLERRNAMLAELVELGRVASGAGGLTELVRAVQPRIVDLMEADGCQVFILRNETLYSVLIYENGRFLDDSSDKALDLDDFPSTRQAIADRAALVIESPEDPRLSDYERRLYEHSGSKSEICVPLVLEDRVVGLLDVYDHRPRDYAEHRDFLLQAGQIMAGTFENALLMEQLDESNQTLGLLVQSGMEFGATLHRDEVLESVARHLCAASAAPNCEIYLLSGGAIRCVACVDHGTSDADYVGAEFPVERLGLARVALETRHPVGADDISADDRVSELERREDLRWGHRAVLFLPLVSRGEVIGLAAIYDDHPRAFERVDFLHSLAQVAAGALVNATLFDEVDRSRERMALVGDVSLELSSSLDLEEVLSSTARRLCAISQAPLCDIYILRDGDRLESVTSIDEGAVDHDWKGRSFSLDEWTAVRRAVETRSPVVIGSRDDPILSAAELALMEEHGEHSTLVVPLISRERVIGVLELTSREPRRTWSGDERATIVSICRFAALAIDNAELYEGIKGMHLGNLKALSSALNAKDYYTLGHAARVAAYMVLLGRELGWPDDLLHEVEEAAYLHDIGKIGVSDRVLLKPSGLNAHEWALMRRHPIFSAEIIRPLFDDALVAGVRHHHERWDGEGYPDGQRGHDIPPVARAMCVADSYDAMSFRRPYRQGLTDRECLEELERCSGTQFDPEMVAAFRRVLDRLAQGRRLAAGVAGRAAAALTAEECRLLRESPSEASSGHRSVARRLDAARGDDVPARCLTLFGRRGRRTVVLAHSAAEKGAESPRPGDEVVADEALAEALAGRALPANVLNVDQWGVWISGVAPVRAKDGEVVAVVSAGFPATQGVTEVEGLRSNVAQTFASMLHDAAVQSGRSELEAITDGLTGLYNHRYFHERLSEELERCREDDTRLALLFCDLDNFRAFNDLHGHAAGDKALRAAARVMEDSVRHVDLVARYGGEEFAAILIDTEESGALEVAERIREGIARLRFGTDSLTVSIGVATSPRDATFKDELVDKADWAMYLAKRRGRGKVMTFGAEHGGETPEQAASVRADHVAMMGELVAAREAFRQRRRSSLIQIALGVARVCGVPAEEIHAALTATAGGVAGATSPAAKIVALAGAYQERVTERPYRARISEAEALDDLLRCPGLRGEEDLARAFEQVLAR